MVKKGEYVAYAMKLHEDSQTNPTLNFSTELSIVLELAVRLAAAEATIIALETRLAALEKKVGLK